MKKYTFAVLCGILILSAVILPNFTYTVRDAEITKALENREYYEQGEICVNVYEIECDEGVGGVTFDVNYDGNNFDFYDIFTADNYTAVYRDNHVGKLTVGVADNKVTDTDKKNKKIRVAVGFKALYLLDASFISFSEDVKELADGNINKSDNYTVSKNFYIYNSKSANTNYEDYIRDIVCDDLDDKDIDTDAPEPSKYIYGDVDNDGIITSVDALLVLRYSVELEAFTDVQNILGDVDGDGEITSVDSLDILRYSVGLTSDSSTGEEILI